ncbi:MAG: DUF423 domain-containing protein [Planctomycetaceae bacterium]|nr:DUF423 domain-containing protein [Planctomycetaceae bacterium]
MPRFTSWPSLRVRAVKPHQWFVLGAWLAALAVVNGAFAAHGLEKRLLVIYQNVPLEDIPNADFEGLIAKRLHDYETGARYQMYHALGLMLLGAVAARRQTICGTLAGLAFFLGILLFSGMLYALVLTNRTMLGAIVPIGGVSFIVGWVALSFAGMKALREEPTAVEIAPPSAP